MYHTHDIVKLCSIVHVIRSKTVSHEQVIQTLLNDFNKLRGTPLLNSDTY